MNYRQETATVGSLTVWPSPTIPGANGPINTTLVQQANSLTITIYINGYKIWPPG